MINEMKLSQVDPGITVAAIIGRLTIGNLLLSMQNSICKGVDGGAKKLVVDLTNLDSIDSAGIGMLIHVQGHINQAGGQVRVAGAKGAVARSFEIVHMHRVMQLDPDLESACASLAGNAASA